MSDCNHENLDTAYCPQCGLPVKNTTLHGLLTHITNQARLFDRQVIFHQKWAAEENNNPRRLAEAERKKALWVKWAGWRDSLKELIDATDSPAKADEPNSYAG